MLDRLGRCAQRALARYGCHPDSAVTLRFFEHQPQVPELLDAWLTGYRRAGEVTAGAAPPEPDRAPGDNGW